MPKRNHPPTGTFVGENMMTLTIIGYYRLTHGWAEFSRGRGIYDEPIFGVTVRGPGGAWYNPNPSRLCHSWREAADLITELGGVI